MKNIFLNNILSQSLILSAKNEPTMPITVSNM
jgi:hypothetical protein